MSLLREWWYALLYRLRLLRRRPWRSAGIAAVAVAAVVLAVTGGPHGLRSATLDRWQSEDVVAVPGQRPGTCASALPPWQHLLSSDRWIVCARSGGYRCYLQRLHALDFERRPLRPSPFGADCRAALAVLRKAGFLP